MVEMQHHVKQQTAVQAEFVATTPGILSQNMISPNTNLTRP